MPLIHCIFGPVPVGINKSGPGIRKTKKSGPEWKKPGIPGPGPTRATLIINT